MKTISNAEKHAAIVALFNQSPQAVAYFIGYLKATEEGHPVLFKSKINEANTLMPGNVDTIERIALASFDMLMCYAIKTNCIAFPVAATVPGTVKGILFEVSRDETAPQPMREYIVQFLSRYNNSTLSIVK